VPGAAWLEAMASQTAPRRWKSEQLSRGRPIIYNPLTILGTILDILRNPPA